MDHDSKAHYAEEFVLEPISAIPPGSTLFSCTECLWIPNSNSWLDRDALDAAVPRRSMELAVRHTNMTSRLPVNARAEYRLRI
jgi:hypothetical protein